MIPIIALGVGLGYLVSKLVDEKKDKKGMAGSWHAKSSKYRTSTDEQQQLKPGYKYVKGGDIVNIKTGKVFKGKIENIVKKKMVKKATKPKKKTVKEVEVDGIKILKTSEKGAMLITDGKTTAWIMPKQRRADGSFTPGAYKSLEQGRPYMDKEEYKKSMIAGKYVKMLGPFRETKTGKAIFRRVSIYENISEQSVGRNFFIPKSLIVKQTENYVIIPTWFFEKKKDELFDELATNSFSKRTFELEVEVSTPTTEELKGLVDGLNAPKRETYENELKGAVQLKGKFKKL